MKKFLIVLMTSLVLLTGCGKKDSEVISFISFDQMKEKIEKNDDFILVIGQDICSACVSYKPTLEEIVKNKKVEIFYVMIEDAKWSADQKEELKNYLKESLNEEIRVTPTTYIIKGGKSEAKLEGNLEYGKILNVLKEKGIVNE